MKSLSMSARAAALVLALALVAFAPQVAFADDLAAGAAGSAASGDAASTPTETVAPTLATKTSTGKAKGVYSAKFTFNAGSFTGSVEYSAHVAGKNWTGWKQNGTAAKTSKKNALNAVKVRLTGEVATHYDVVYRCRMGSGTWQPWAVNGGIAGSTSKSARVTAVQAKLVKKGTEQTLADGTYVVSTTADAGKDIAASGSSIKKASYSTSKQAHKFYVRNERGGITLQSVSKGKFVTDSGSAGNTGALALAKWTASDSQVWNLEWDGGVRLVNKATGRVLGLSGSTGATNAVGSGFMFNTAHLVKNGTYVIKNAARSMALDVAGGSYKSGANIQVYKPNGAGPQAFTLKRKTGEWYTITNVLSQKVVELAGGSKSSGANVRQRTSNKSKAQQWHPMLDRSGNLYFKNRASGTALTAQKAGASGGNVVGSPYTGAAAQSWKLAKSKWKLTGDSSLDKYIMKIVRKNGGNLRRCFNWMGSLRHVQSVDSRLHHGIMSQKVINSYVRIAKKRGVADCYTDAAVFCCLARGCGYKANMRAGGCPSASSGTVPHGWTEVVKDGHTYVCDANLRRDLPSYNWFMVTYASAPVAYSL